MIIWILILFLFVYALIMTYIEYLIMKHSKNYPKIHEYSPRPFFMIKNNRWGLFFIKMVFTLRIFVKSTYYKNFNELIRFDEIKKTKDKKLISLVEKYRLLSWLSCWVGIIGMIIIITYGIRR